MGSVNQTTEQNRHARIEHGRAVVDSLINAAALALARGDPLAALDRVALRDDAPALALRGIAMAQLGDFVRARVLVQKAARRFGSKAPKARARCVVVEAEIALASRDLNWPARQLTLARDTLLAHGDYINAAHARYLDIRRLLLIGQVDSAQRLLSEIDPAPLPAALRAAHELMIAGIAMRRLQTHAAHTALERAGRAAQCAGIAALIAETEQAFQLLRAPAARLVSKGNTCALLLEEVETLMNSAALVVDACRYVVRYRDTQASLVTRPLLFTLARTLAEAWPAEVARDTLIERAFRTRHHDDTHRARLRVEIGRLRKLLSAIADIHATKHGFVLKPHRDTNVVVLARPIEEKHADVLAFLADGESWPSSALALALGVSQRSVQRALDALAASGKVQAFGHGRARRWMTPPMPGFATSLLLPLPLPGA